MPIRIILSVIIRIGFLRVNTVTEGDFLKYLNRIRNVYIAAGIVFALVGLVFMIFPKMSLNIICVIAGAVMIAFGIIKVFAYFSDDRYHIAFQFDLALGILSTIVGIIVLIHSDWVISVLPIIAGLLITINALFSLQASIDAKRFGLGVWGVMLALSLVCIVLGVVLVFFPVKSSIVIIELYGAGCLLAGIEKVVAAIYATQRIKKM